MYGFLPATESGGAGTARCRGRSRRTCSWRCRCSGSAGRRVRQGRSRRRRRPVRRRDRPVLLVRRDRRVHPVRPVRHVRRSRPARRVPGRPPRRAAPKPAPNSPLAGSKTPRPIASKRSCIMPRSRLALFPVIAIASPEVSGENPGGSSNWTAAASVSGVAACAAVAASACCCTSSVWNPVAPRPRPPPAFGAGAAPRPPAGAPATGAAPCCGARGVAGSVLRGASVRTRFTTWLQLPSAGIVSACCPCVKPVSSAVSV